LLAWWPELTRDCLADQPVGALHKRWSSPCASRRHAAYLWQHGAEALKESLVSWESLARRCLSVVKKGERKKGSMDRQRGERIERE
jgi:hypothetical protein